MWVDIIEWQVKSLIPVLSHTRRWGNSVITPRLFAKPPQLARVARVGDGLKEAITKDFTKRFNIRRGHGRRPLLLIAL